MLKENGMIMISEEEYNRTINDLLKDRNNYRRILFNLIEKKVKSRSEDIEVSRQDFVDIYSAAVGEMFEKMDEDEDIDDSPIYGKDVTVHWNGIYCNCEDGATVYNHLIPGIEGVISEID